MSKIVDYKDGRGYKRRVEIPDDAPDDHAKFGILVGPPDISGLGLSKDLERKLNNALFDRRIFTRKDARPDALFGALQAVFRVDVTTLLNAYKEQEVRG